MRSYATILNVAHVSKRFGKQYALSDVSFQIKEGEIYGLIGPNGAGKTTAIKTIVGHLAPNSGKIEINHYDLKKEFTDAIDFVGAIIEYPMHYDYMTGYQNLKLCANMYPEVTRARIKEVIDLVGIRPQIHQKVRNYSLGSRQRLALGMEIMNYPQLLILDEPMNGLDPMGIRDLYKLLRSLADNGMSILITSHLTGGMEEICDRIGILSQGHLIAERDINEFRQERSHRYACYVDDAKRAATLLKEQFADKVEILQINQPKTSMAKTEMEETALLPDVRASRRHDKHFSDEDVEEFVNFDSPVSLKLSDDDFQSSQHLKLTPIITEEEHQAALAHTGRLDDIIQAVKHSEQETQVPMAAPGESGEVVFDQEHPENSGDPFQNEREGLKAIQNEEADIRPTASQQILSERTGSLREVLQAVGSADEELLIRIDGITAADVTRTLVQGDIMVNGINELKQTLEALYLELTGGAEIE